VEQNILTRPIDQSTYSNDYGKFFAGVMICTAYKILGLLGDINLVVNPYNQV
jgi:hypothetical protein